MDTRVLIIHLGALGAVVRSTALLPAIRRKYPRAHITWITDRPGHLILQGNSLVDRVLTSDHEGALEMQAMTYDATFVVDKSAKASGLFRVVETKLAFGFAMQGHSIQPINDAARELWTLGLSNHEKFFVNKKTEAQLIHEALELGPYIRDDYQVVLSTVERAEVRERGARLRSGGRGSNAFLVGLNTGCAATIAAKKLSVHGHVEAMRAIQMRIPSARFVLLGGKEDTVRNSQIAALGKSAGFDVVQTATENGLRDGMISVAACDVIVTGDSLGMHLAIGLKVPVAAWFGPTCSHEIEFFGRGRAILTKASCSPCWKRSCNESKMCYDQIDWTELAECVYALSCDFYSTDRILGRYASDHSAGQSAEA